MQSELISYMFPSCLPFVNEAEALMATLLCLTGSPWCPTEFILPLSFVQMFHCIIPGTNVSCAPAWHWGKNEVDLEGPGLHITLLRGSSEVCCQAEGRQPSSWCSAVVLRSGAVTMPPLYIDKGGLYISLCRKNSKFSGCGQLTGLLKGTMAADRNDPKARAPRSDVILLKSRSFSNSFDSDSRTT